MRGSKTKTAVIVGAVILAKLAACSPKNGDSSVGKGHGSGLPDGSVGAGSAANQGAGGDGFFPGFGDSGGASHGGGNGVAGGCAELDQKPEQIITYRDATVTDTITTYSPVAIYIMQDRSSSMVGYLGTGDPQSWATSSSAVKAFVTDPASTGLDVGLAVFPPNPTPATAAQGDCANGTDCGAPVAEIGPLPQNSAAIVNGMQAATPPMGFGIQPNVTPTECALRGMINHCIDWKKKSGEQCVAVLVTDGQPYSCDLNANNLAQIVATGLTNGVTTFTIGFPGSQKAFLDQIAAAGGTTESVSVVDANGKPDTAKFTAALNAIRGKVSSSTSHQVSVATTISSPLPCAWTIPEPSNGTTFDKAKVNVKFTPPGAASQLFGYVAQADCARTDSAWYYDDPANPKKVLLCPTTCDKVKTSSGADIKLAFGCAQIQAVLH